MTAWISPCLQAEWIARTSAHGFEMPAHIRKTPSRRLTKINACIGPSPEHGRQAACCIVHPTGASMRHSGHLLRHLIAAVLIKLVFLTGLWFAFVRDARVGVDADTTADWLAGSILSSKGQR
jgi:hypothetical protein